MDTVKQTDEVNLEWKYSSTTSHAIFLFYDLNLISFMLFAINILLVLQL